MSLQFRIRFEPGLINELAARYDYPSENHIEHGIAPRSIRAGFFTKPDFLDLCRWKTPRSQSKCNKNSEKFIREVTGIALSTKNERIRIGILTLLHGVSWPTASVILHFTHNDPYPILDYRALWSLGVEKRPNVYTFDLWWAYTEYCRELAKENAVSMRVLDRALWRYSKEEQKQ